MIRTLALVAALAACSHSSAVNLRYAALVPLVGGSLLVAEPVFAGDGLQRHTTEAGVVVVLVGLALGALSYAVDPQGQR